ncbi:MAG: hypothetical protein NXY57DRAFT_716781 [Lentinula lateritia]|uniref:F-box domain-containing protein n=1 Tax=Lentinula lateritia TaxID=40482 RepID=A0ABQ8V704_9AGAR|nr:MAG: hypothetical protein NXY57DRAFT_716781 [Lentinula lateritia]KAJ4477627.1 hypothetical protein C8R41DRAFT_845116 [Lentinula lateritia]
MPTTQRNKPALQSFRWPSSRAISVVTHTEPETLPQYISDLPTYSEPTLLQTLLLSCQSIQKIIARLFADPGFTRASVFRFSAPIVVFISFITAIALLPQDWYIDQRSENKAMSVKFSEVGSLCIMSSVVVLGTLSFWWILIWVLAICGRRFMEVDLMSGRRTYVGIFDNLLGGLFTN